MKIKAIYIHQLCINIMQNSICFQNR